MLCVSNEVEGTHRLWPPGRSSSRLQSLVTHLSIPKPHLPMTFRSSPLHWQARKDCNVALDKTSSPNLMSGAEVAKVQHHHRQDLTVSL